jgi:hypothetical protein
MKCTAASFSSGASVQVENTNVPPFLRRGIIFSRIDFEIL